MLIFKSFVLTISIAKIVNWLNNFISTLPIKEVNDGPRLYIRRDLKSGRIY